MADDPRIERETRPPDLLAPFDVLDIERAHLVSHDMGVLAAIQLIYDHPERVRTAVQLAVPPAFMKFRPKVLPGFRPLPPFVWHRPGASLRGTFSRPTSRARCRRQPSNAPRPDAPPDIDAAVGPLLRGMVLPEAMRWARGVYRLRRLRVPTLVVFGRQGPPVGRTARAHLPQSGAVRRSRRTHLCRRRSALRHGRRPRCGRRPRARMARTSRITHGLSSLLKRPLIGCPSNFRCPQAA